MDIGVIIVIIGCALIYACTVAYFGLKKRGMWDELKVGSYVLCVRPDGEVILEYVVEYKPEEDRVRLNKEGWVSKFDFLCGKNNYYVENF